LAVKPLRRGAKEKALGCAEANARTRVRLPSPLDFASSSGTPGGYCLARLGSTEAKDLPVEAKSTRHSLLVFQTTRRSRALRVIVLVPYVSRLRHRAENIPGHFSSRARERLQEHNAGKNPSTAAYRLWRFAAIFSFTDQPVAFPGCLNLDV
jgi:hypothetical protein